jgi:hypothetical protein
MPATIERRTQPSIHIESDKGVRLMKYPFPHRRVAAATAAAVLGLLSLGVAQPADASVPASDSVVFDAIVTPLPGNLPSLGFQATQTAEFGDLVQLAGTNRVLQSATVTMSDWAKASDYNSAATTWTHPITFNVYDVDTTTPVRALGALLGSVTQIVTIPWRPEADPTNCPAAPTAWFSSTDNTCYNGLAFNVTFDLGAIGTVPDKIIYGIAYNTNTWGASPIGLPGPYESLNVGLNSAAPTVGTDVDPDAVFWNTMTAGNYADGGSLVGTFRSDANWTPYRPAVSLTASATSGSDCLFSTTGSTITLLGDCTTDQTILVPDGMTLDGNSHSITAVDPVGGHFLGAVVANAGPNANVTNVTVTASHLTDACDGGVDRLRGILLDGAAGSITNNTVIGINQGRSGCQEGNAIEVRNIPLDRTHHDDDDGLKSVAISGNTISDYQKTGIVANGDVAVKITHNFVTGAGKIDYIAQNGIQIGFGAKATIKDNTSSGNWYTPKSDVACGILYFEAGRVTASHNTLFANERNQCNFGKGGGESEHESD